MTHATDTLAAVLERLETWAASEVGWTGTHEAPPPINEQVLVEGSLTRDGVLTVVRAARRTDGRYSRHGDKGGCLIHRPQRWKRIHPQH